MAAVKIAAALEMNEILLSNYDAKTVELLVKKQVDVIGGLRTVFERIEQNFKRQLVDPFFVKEMWDLFDWRIKFFKEHFPQGSFVTEDEEEFVSDEDKNFHYEDTMKYEVICNFDKLMILAGRNSFESIVFLRRDWWLSRETRYIYDREWAKQRFEAGAIPWFLYFQCLEISYSDLVHMAVELYPKGPRTLEELAMKAVLKKDGLLDPNVYGNILWKKSEQGLYAVGDDLPWHVSEKGKRFLKEMRNFYIKWKADAIFHQIVFE